MSRSVFLVTLALAASLVNAADPEITRQVERIEDHWNSASADKLASLFHEQGDHQTSTGRLIEGRPLVREAFVTGFASPPLKGSHIDISDVRAVQLSDSISFVDFSWTTTMTSSEGEQLEPRHGRSTAILTKTENGWLIRALRSMRPQPALQERETVD